ncbi:uncharacterized protein IUM83_08788 [Phytophthora cinnamomi]|uniref:uncharacterized protein n=1 Tax=Phytophthora cinnamomi TaxID=4785 RepID=UPI003559377B|nr:hypothetical protein IUM83_08788 [Phytophthora cinnamomi]
MAERKSFGSRICLFWTRVLLRFVQFCASLVAYIALQTAGVSYQSTGTGRAVSVVVSSGAMNFARVINFLAFLYAFAFLIFVEWLRLCVHPVIYCEKIMDFVVLVSLTIANLVLLLSNITLHCRRGYGRFVHCGEMYLAIAMTFLSALAFLLTVMIGKSDEDQQRRSRDREAQRQSTDRADREGRESGAYLQQGGATPVPIVTAQPAA